MITKIPETKQCTLTTNQNTVFTCKDICSYIVDNFSYKCEECIFIWDCPDFPYKKQACDMELIALEYLREGKYCG